MAETGGRARQASRGDQLVGFIAGAPERQYPPEVIEAARRAFVDYLGVTVGSLEDPPARAVRKAVQRWQAPGKATVFRGFRTAPALAALANGTATHSQDYDDTHPQGAGHPSGPCWSAALALGEQHGRSEAEMIGAFITGYEVMARLGGGGVPGVGRSLQRRGLHPTAVMGRPAAAATASVLLRLDPAGIASALGNAATCSAGLLGSFGTHAKPFHAGKSAMDGIMAAELAADGFEASATLFELEKGLLSAFIQDGAVEVPPLDDLGSRWEVVANGFKQFASCRATHAAAEAATSLYQSVKGRRIERVLARVHPHSLVTAGKRDPRTALEGKFSVQFCVALGLSGYKLVPADFVETTMADRGVMALLPLTTVEGVAGQQPTEAHVDVLLADGSRVTHHTKVLKGHPDNPLSWDDLRAKFEGLLRHTLSPADTGRLFDTARRIDQPGALAAVMELVGAMKR